jgi:FMN-dependent oxidoreductase (nitrilotriacetate monooxygenase family)
MKRFAQTLERGRFDAFFMADHLAVLNMPIDALKRSHTATSFEPFTLLSALAAVTERIGLVATGSTTFDLPYHVARRFASLDHISNGRAGWNIVTTSNPDAALNFGLTEHVEHDERYRRAREFYDVVTGLWDSWADEAFIRDVDSGIYFDPDRLHVLDHKGEHLSVRGPLNIARPVQGWPVVVQAGASDAGRQLAAETAEAVFTAQNSLATGKEFYADVKGRMEKAGRARDHMKILPATFVVVGDTVEEARARRAKLDSLVDYANAIASLSIALGHDASKFDPDGPLPDIPESNESKSARERATAMARRDNLTAVRSPSDSAATAASRWWARRRRSRTRWRTGSHPTPATVSSSCSRTYQAGLMTSSTRWRRSCSGGGFSGPNTRGRRCGRTSACRGRRTGSSETLATAQPAILHSPATHTAAAVFLTHSGTSLRLTKKHAS